MIKIDIKHWITGEIKFTAEIDCKKSDSESLKFGLAFKWAIKNKKDLRGADLRGAYLTGAYLTGAYLTGAYLTGAYLTGADLRGAYLRGAYLTGAYLTGAYLTGADLTGADLRGADLTGADLTGAYLTGAYLTGAYLTGADGEKILLVGDRPLLQIGPMGSRESYLMAFHTEKGIYIQAGCWFGILEDFEKRVTASHQENKYAQEYHAVVSFIRAHSKIWQEERKEIAA